MFAGIYEIPGYLVSWLYGVTHSYAGAIALVAVLVMVLSTPLVLKSTAGMLKMQLLGPELKQLQREYKDDRATQQAEMMKLYQENGVNPMASCWPMALQMPVFLVMFRILHGLTFEPVGANGVVARAVMNASGLPADAPIGFYPRFISHSSELYQSLVRQTEMNSIGLDLSHSAWQMLQMNFTRGLLYLGLVVLYGALSLVQQRMVAARAAMSPTMSPAQQKMMQYLPVAFALFQLFFLLALVIYYLVQTVIRIGQQAYITRRFYGHDESLGRKAQAASERAREISGDEGGLAGAFKNFGKRDDSETRNGTGSKNPSKNGAKPATSGRVSAKKESTAAETTDSKRTRPGGKQTTAPKGRPTPRNGSSRSGRPQSAKSRRRSR